MVNYKGSTKSEDFNVQPGLGFTSLGIQKTSLWIFNEIQAPEHILGPVDLGNIFVSGNSCL